MQEFSQVEIRRAVLEAKRRQAELEVPKAKRRVLPSERAAEKLVTGWAEYSGLDIKALTAIQAQHRREYDRSIPERQAGASRVWARRIRATHAGAAAWSQGIVAAAGDFLPTFFTIDTPQAIFASDERFVKERHFEPLKSSAKIVVDRKVGSVDKLSFLYLFRNEMSTPFLFDFFTVITASGHLSLRQAGHLTHGSGFSSVNAVMEVMPSTLPSEPQLLVFLVSTTGVPFWWVDHTEEKTFSEGVNLFMQNVMLGSLATASILVSITVESDFDGRLIADLNKGTFGVQCPLMAVVPKKAVFKPATSLSDASR